MELVIDNFGTFIGREGNTFKISSKNKQTEEFSADKVKSIKIISPSSISSKAIELAIEKNIDIVLTNYYGKPYARIYPCKLGGTTLTRRKQLEATKNEKGLIISKQIVIGKIKNQINLLKILSKTRKKIFDNEIQLIEDILKKLKKTKLNNIEEDRSILLGYEGYSSSIYFSCLSKIIPFKSREHTSNDIFNICLNYGYGILYSEIERSCIIVGLDPFLGFIHTDRYNKPSLVLDLIEPYRQFIVDKAIINLVVQKRISDKDLEEFENNKILSKKGREKVILEVLSRLSLKVNYKNKKIELRNLIREKSRELVRFLLDEEKKFDSFIFRY